MHNCEQRDEGGREGERERERDGTRSRSNEATPPQTLTDQSLPSSSRVCLYCCCPRRPFYGIFFSLSLSFFAVYDLNEVEAL